MGRAAEIFGVDQVLVVTGMAGTELPEEFGEGGEDSKLYAIRIGGEDYDLKVAGVKDHERQIAVVIDGVELVTIIRKMIKMLIDAGEDALIVQDILKDMRLRHTKGGKLN